MTKFPFLLLVQVANGIESLAPHLPGHARRVGNVQNGIAFGAALNALEDRGEKAASPGAGAGAGLYAAGDENNEARQIFVLTAQAIGNPGTHRRAAGTR